MEIRRTGSGGPSAGPHAGLETSTLPGQDSGFPNPSLSNDWTARMQVLISNPELAQEQFAQWQLIHQQFQHLQYQQQPRSIIQPGVVADVPSPRRGRQVHWGPVEHGYANGLDHESGRCVEAQPIFETKGEALSVLPQSVVERPFELHREDKIPGLAAMIRERGIWPRCCPFFCVLVSSLCERQIP